MLLTMIASVGHDNFTDLNAIATHQLKAIIVEWSVMQSGAVQKFTLIFYARRGASKSVHLILHSPFRRSPA